MDIWILRPIDITAEDSPWEPWYDKAFGYIVQAPDEQTARELADEGLGYEGNAWIHANLTTCEKLVAGDNAKVIMEDFRAS